MPYRWTNIRMVDPGTDLDDTVYRPLSLWRAALAAAEETMQGSPLAPAWLQLFRAHLSSSETEMLRWRGHLGENTEVRRAYSGLYGRYFARALLATELGITHFVPLNTTTTSIQSSVTVTRVESGDIPDWIAWDPKARCYVLCEAKGRLSEQKGRFLHGKPDCIDAGMAQFDRVEVRDSDGGRIETKNWLVANLWSTDRIKRNSVSLLWDPLSDGRGLTPEEARLHSEAMHRQRNTNIATWLGNPQLKVRIAIDPSGEDIQALSTDTTSDSRRRPIERPSREPHEANYHAAIITPLGVQPIRTESDLQAVLAIRERTASTDEPAIIFGLSTATPQVDELQQTPWLSDNGIASPDGLSLFNLRNVKFS